MTRGQRRLVFSGCVLGAVVIHLWVGDWTAAEPYSGQAWRSIGCEYRASSALAGFRQSYQYTSESVPSIFGKKGGQPELNTGYTEGHTGIALLCFGVLVPILLIFLGGFVLLGGHRIEVPEARPVKKT